MTRRLLKLPSLEDVISTAVVAEEKKKDDP